MSVTTTNSTLLAAECQAIVGWTSCSNAGGRLCSNATHRPVVTKGIPNFSRLDACRPDVAIRTQAMLRAREVVAARSWATSHEPITEAWGADVLADPRARHRPAGVVFITTMVAGRANAPGGCALAFGAMPVAAGNGELTITCLMGKFRNGELVALLSDAKPRSDAFAPHYDFALSWARRRALEGLPHSRDRGLRHH